MKMSRMARWAAGVGAAVIAVAAPALADLPISSTTDGTITHINYQRHQLTLKLGNGVNHEVHYGKAQIEGGSFARLRVGEHIRVFSSSVDPHDRGLDATKLVIKDESTGVSLNNAAGGAYKGVPNGSPGSVSSDGRRSYSTGKSYHRSNTHVTHYAYRRNSGKVRHYRTHHRRSSRPHRTR